MELNRKLQFDILVALRDVYPDSLLVSAMPGFSHDREFMGNLFYLQEHGVIVGGDIREPGQCRSMVDAQITKAGLDFLADDGGLEAILGKQTVKFEIGELLEAIALDLHAETHDRLANLKMSEIHDLLLKLIHYTSRRQPELLTKFLSAIDSGTDRGAEEG
ncbi:MAG: hypothetical protein GVY02_03775 [Bacteroidetes bacterium]|jgi:hypothetical protein|nr:hypothetical protein [Bacteroidota bacterium]